MKRITTYLDSLYVPWRLLVGLFVLSFILSLVYLTRPFGLTSFKGHYVICSTIYTLLMAILCFRGTPRLFQDTVPADQAGRRFAPVMLGLSLLCLATGQFVWVFQLFTMAHPPDFPSLAYFIYLGTYPLCFCAILLLPSRSISVLTRLRLLSDSLLLITVITTLCYYFLVGPLLTDQNVPLLAKILGRVFPATDLVLMFCVLQIALRSGERALQPVLILLGTAMLLIFISHVLYLYDLSYERYNETSWIIIWLFGLIPIVGAAQTMSRVLRESPAAEIAPPSPQSALPRRWETLFIYGLALFFGVVILLIRLQGGKEVFPGQFLAISIGGFILLFLMVLRQLLAIYEVSILQKVLQEKNKSLYVANEQLEQQATTDPLTGLLNHRTLVQHLDRTLTYARSHQIPFAIIFLDIDDFKVINDQYGHQMGDRLLRWFSELVQTMLQPGDGIGRWGGEEFVVILPGRTSSEAFAMAEHIRTTVAQQHIPGHDDLRVTCSLGIAAYPQDTNERAILVQAADTAMYAAKRLGRNQTRTAHEPMVLAIGVATKALEAPDEAEMLGMVEALLALQEARDQASSQHARDVAALSMKLALSLGLSDTEAYLISLGGLLHDLGRVTLPDTLLFKRGEMSANEKRIAAQHPLIGAEIINTIPALHEVAAIVHAHHERMDGSGYPDSLQGDKIPLGARIVAVADAYDMLTTGRSEYFRGSPTQVLEELQKRAGSQFDPRVVAALLELFSPPLQTPIAKVA